MDWHWSADHIKTTGIYHRNKYWQDFREKGTLEYYWQSRFSNLKIKNRFTK